MTGPGSVTVWLDHLKASRNRDEAVGRLWERYFTQLVEHARRHLRSRRAAADGEDAALSAFDGFVRAVAAGKFPKLGDRDDLWQVLLMLTANKARNAVRDENRLKRGGGFEAHVIASADSVPGGVPIASADPNPAEAAELAEGAERLLAALGDAELRRVAELALAGHTNAEIAAAIGKALASVERKLRRIRETWLGIGTG
jgi:DNA-directed RNA polymerase specialized sigma24 family protein